MNPVAVTTVEVVTASWESVTVEEGDIEVSEAMTAVEVESAVAEVEQEKSNDVSQKRANPSWAIIMFATKEKQDRNDSDEEVEREKKRERDREKHRKDRRASGNDGGSSCSLWQLG